MVVAACSMKIVGRIVAGCSKASPPMWLYGNEFSFHESNAVACDVSHEMFLRYRNAGYTLAINRRGEGGSLNE